MNLSKIGFYTLSDERAKNASASSPLSRCELILSSRCNFKCPYCRSVGGSDIPIEDAMNIVNIWGDHGLQNIRFSGGEPTLYHGLEDLVRLSRKRGVKRCALSTNGSAPAKKYKDLLLAGVDDFSISLDACCAEDGDRMSGGVKGAWGTVIENIRWISKEAYVTVGVVLTADNASRTEEIIGFADSLGVSDIRVIPAAQAGCKLPSISISPELLDKYPILKYREANLCNGKPVRGCPEKRCGLVLDDMAVMGADHYPCIIYMREGGNPIGPVSATMRKEREDWYRNHDCTNDTICASNCLDVCVDYNRKFALYRNERE
jgi:MoaA/NifB/PqqE/SkfB family radical SAM enzyme